jgi:hypothetical protein
LGAAKGSAARSEGRVPVSTKDRLKVVMTLAAAILVAAASPSAWAQTPGISNSQTPDAQTSDSQTQSAEAPISQAPALPPPELRGTDQPSLQAETSPDIQSQVQPDSNPIVAQPPAYGLPSPVTDTTD